TNIKIQICHENTLSDVTPEQINQILKQFHVTPLGGHQGVNRTFHRIKQHYQWRKMYKDIKKYIQNCELCQKNKCSKKTKLPMSLTTTSSKPFEKIFLDIVGPLNETEKKNKYLLTFQDDLTKFSIAIPIPDQKADTVARNFTTEIICRYGVPSSLVTDQGTNFLSDKHANY